MIERNRQDGRSIPVPLCVELGAACCDAVQRAAHPRGRLPRVVQPETLFLSDDGSVRLLVTYADAFDPGMGRHFCYTSPEAASGSTDFQRADVFAVGAILWELLAGRILFFGTTDYGTMLLVRAAVVPPLARFNADVDPDLDAIVRSALAKDPADRCETVVHLGHALTDYLSRRGTAITPDDLRALLG